MVEAHLESPRRIDRSDRRDDFTSGAKDLDIWIRQSAFQNQRAGNSVTYVTTLAGRVVGFYSLAASGVSPSSAPQDLSKGRPDPIPCILLARFAVDRRYQGRGVGAALLQDALRRTLSTAEAVGTACLLIHCRDDSARAFYLRNLPCVESPTDPLHLMLPLTDIRRMIAS